MQCALMFTSASSIFSRKDKIHQALALLTWRAHTWMTTTLNHKTYAEFEREFQEVFDHPESGKAAGKKLLSLKQI